LTKNIVVIGAGFGGLAAGAELAREGLDVTLLEAHIYPGGCAGSFYHKGYSFESGATLAGGFAPGAPMDRIADRFDIDWEARLASRAMEVHMPDESSIKRWTDAEHWEHERRAQFGDKSEPFWHWQEGTADALWRFSLRLPPWPPQTNLFQAWGSRLAPRMWMVGDTIFPGQSVPAVMLGGLRVAQSIIAESARSRSTFRHSHKIQFHSAGD